MSVRTDSDWTIITEQDLHDESYRLAHFHDNNHVTLSIPLNSAGHRSRQLAPSQCLRLAWCLLSFYLTRRLTHNRQIVEPQTPDDFQI